MGDLRAQALLDLMERPEGHPKACVELIVNARERIIELQDECARQARIGTGALVWMSGVARARGLAEAIAACSDDASLRAIRELAVEIAGLLAERADVEAPLSEGRPAPLPDDERTRADRAGGALTNRGIRDPKLREP